jgi:hypothetical protein
MLQARDMIKVLLAVFVNNGVLTLIEAEKALKKADENLPQAPIQELSIEQLASILK